MKSKYADLFEAIAKMTDEEFVKFTQDSFKSKSSTNRINDVHVEFPCDLRTMTQTIKLNMAHPATLWTGYINNAGTLLHIVHPPSNTMIRYMFDYPVKKLSPKRQYYIVKSVVDALRQD